MSEMLIPTPSDLLRCCNDALTSDIAPALSGGKERSSLATVQHLLRYIEQRVEREGQILFDEISLLKPLLADVAEHLKDRREAAALCERIVTCTARERDARTYPSLGILAVEVAALRACVASALVVMNDARQESDESLHRRLLDYVAWQIEQEGQLVNPAFRGHGPRR